MTVHSTVPESPECAGILCAAPLAAKLPDPHWRCMAMRSAGMMQENGLGAGRQRCLWVGGGTRRGLLPAAAAAGVARSVLTGPHRPCLPAAVLGGMK